MSDLAALVNRNLKSAPFSPIRSIFEEVLKLENSGESVIRLDIGSPNFKAPKEIIKNVNKYLSEGKYNYSSNWGVARLRNELVDSVKSKSNLDFNPSNEIIITNGASEAVATAIYSLLNDGEEFIIPTPAWPHYIACFKLFDKSYVEVETTSNENFKLTPEKLKKNITDKTKILILNSPCNPTGSVYSHEEFELLYQICVENNILIILDEIYENLNFKHKKSLLSSCYDKGRVLYINGFSKNFGMTGFRLGYLMASSELMKEMIKYHQYTNVCGQEFAQEACADFLSNPDDVLKFNIAVKDNLEKQSRLLTQFKGQYDICMTEPEGAFYTFIKIPEGYSSAQAFCMDVLKNDKISLIPGDAFGTYYSSFYRLSYGSVTESELGLALELLSKYYIK
ncbi:pyridoxal phosphate-dependent aminotransferase [Pseudoalteromonas sp. C2R02]|uniref:pyridoxal phosphate-dependent aminotransferase n=1 Tax=Pseudoalteromonas sp. C2R02 TaxID=2841565 RepID=UPI001C090CF5|nr:pyridoxal phosphate-dependent aminotransferase [Pseudoalteromonas sp. C2R02]MBU2971743.1 pyridoxal phosphate-dependent aminotransferase [Pseudoalteromonas sp. C2R02]